MILFYLQAIDTNNDGLLSMDEFKAAGTDFFVSDDEKSPNQVELKDVIVCNKNL